MCPKRDIAVPTNGRSQDRVAGDGDSAVVEEEGGGAVEPLPEGGTRIPEAVRVMIPEAVAEDGFLGEAREGGIRAISSRRLRTWAVSG